MNRENGALGLAGLPRELEKRKSVLLGELRHRTLWFIRLRWAVPPCIIAGAFISSMIGFEFQFRAVVLTAAAIACYNLALYIVGRSIRGEDQNQRQFIYTLTYTQVALDYGAMFFLVHFTGGAASPLIFFFIFHIMFAAILLPTRWAFFFAGLASAGMIFLASAEYLGLLPHHPLVFRGGAIDLTKHPSHMAVELLFFSTSVFVTAIFSTSIQRMLRKRILKLSQLSETVVSLNDKFESLYQMMQHIGPNKRLDDLLEAMTAELSDVMHVRGTSIKLLSDDGRRLRYEAVYGLGDNFFKGKIIDLTKSSLNRKIIDGQAYVAGNVTEREMFQFGEDLEKARIQSVLFVPMNVENRVIGILGAYCSRSDRFTQNDVDFFKLAAGLVSIALENARAYQAIDDLIKERSWFMLKLAHNLRAPLGAMHSMLEVVRGKYLGDISEKQEEHLRRVDRRVGSMIDIINELLILAKGRTEGGTEMTQEVDLAIIAGRIHRTFQDEAEEKGIRFDVHVSSDLPLIRGNNQALEQMIENLVSNAVKYTFSGGRVTLEMSAENQGKVSIEVKDTGIGIPREEKPKLFTEFFRAANAKDVEEVGTGLGLAIVGEIVDQHGGQIKVESEEGIGTTVRVIIPDHL